MSWKERKNRIVDEYFGFQSANQLLENGRVLKHALWPSILPKAGEATDGNGGDGYRTWTGAEHDEGLTTITDSSLPEGDLDFEQVLAHGEVSGEEHEFLGHYLEVLHPEDNLYARFRIIEVVSATAIVVFDPENQLGGIEDGRYRVTYNIDRAEHYGHTHDGLDSAPITVWNRPYALVDDELTAWPGPVLVGVFESTLTALHDEEIDLSAVTNSAQRLAEVRFKVLLVTTNQSDHQIGFVLKSASGWIDWDVCATGVSLPSTLKPSTAGSVRDWYIGNFNPARSVPQDFLGGSGSPARYIEQRDFSLRTESQSVYLDLDDLTVSSPTLEGTLLVYVCGWRAEKP